MRQEMSQVQEQRLQTVLAPQLRQSLECLQVPILELQNLIQHELETNPTLEQEAKDNDQLEVEPGTSEIEKEDAENSVDEDFEVLARLDDEWGDYFRENRPPPYNVDKNREKHDFMMNSLTESESLQQHLLEQLKYHGLSKQNKATAELLIGNIDSDGYLTSSPAELSATTGIPESQFEEMLDIIRDFHPIGVGARDLEDCLELQLKRLGVEDPHIYGIVKNHIHNLGKKNHTLIAKSEDIPIEKVSKIAEFIHTLEPRPGRIFSTETTHYVQPEATIKKVNGQYTVIMHNEYIPELRISNLYKKMIKDPSVTKESKEYVRNKIQAAVFLIKSIRQRQETLKNICWLILDVQEEFMNSGVSGLRPLVMADIASKLDIHETTVSRAISNKYIQTPQGLLEMKYFFTPGYCKNDGSLVSSRTIIDMVGNYISEEDPSKPLSDNAIVDLLKTNGFTIARRTVAKYRNQLNIPSSHQRKIS